MLAASMAIGTTITEILADIGVGTIVVHGINKLISPTPINLAHKICLYIGEAAIVNMVCDKCNDSIEKGIDELANLYKEVYGKEEK